MKKQVKKQVKRVMFTISNLAGGGAERKTTVLANQFSRWGIEVSICCVGYTGKPVAYELDERVKLEELAHSFPSSILNNPWKILYQISLIRQKIKSFRPDVVVCVGIGVSYRTILSCLGLRAPVVYHNTNAIQSFPRVPFWCWLVKKCFRRLKQNILLLAHGAIFFTDEQASCFPRSPWQKRIVLLNPVYENPLWLQPPPLQDGIILAVGRLHPQKNHLLLIRAFSLLAADFPAWKLRICGEGPLRGEIEALITKLGLEGRVELPGFTSDIFNEYFKSAFFVMSSAREGLGNVLLESACLGIPRITTDNVGGAARMIVRDGVDGLVVPNHDEAALADAMRKLMEDKELRRALGERGKEWREKASADVVAESWLSFLREVAES